MMYTYLLRILAPTIFSLLSGGLTAYAQQATTPAASIPSGTGVGGTLAGVLVDSTTGKPVEFATVALVSPSTNKPISGTTTDDQGRFTLPLAQPGRYQLQYSAVGYRTRNSRVVTTSDATTLQLGTVLLLPDVRTLGEVVVIGQAAVIEEKVDRLVYNADKDILAKGGNATDVLRKVPLLTVDLDGNVSIRGNQNIKVLINNKPSTIVASSVSDALKQIPADQIKTVEVVTSPSAKYDAEGSGGIINIITKKNSLQGLNLSLESGFGNRGSLLGLNGNYRKRKLGVMLGGYGYATYNTPTRTRLDQTSQTSGQSILTRQLGQGNSSGLFGQYTMGFDYDLANDQSITAGVRYGVRNTLSQLELITQLFTDNALNSAATRHVDTQNLSGTIDANLDYIHTFKGGAVAGARANPGGN